MSRLSGLFLTVQRAPKEDVYQDVARIPEFQRKDTLGNLIPEGILCVFETDKGRSYLFARGIDADGSIVLLDEVSRNKLGVKVGEEAAFRITTANVWDEICWSLGASQPAYRIASRIAILSLILGVIGLILGILSLYNPSTH